MPNIFNCSISLDDKAFEQSIDKKFGIGSLTQARFDDIVKNGMTPYVPLLTGTLIRSADISTVLGSGEIIYRTPYARKQYYENPGPEEPRETGALRGKRWAERAGNDLKSVWVAELQRYIKGT